MTSKNEKLDLILERTTDISPEKIWRALTEPELLKQWFCPLPWKVVRAEIEARPGGIFLTEMQGPNGEAPGAEAGCFLEVVPPRKLVWTSALGPGFQPVSLTSPEQFHMSVVIQLEPQANGGTKYTATVLHSDEKSRKAHEEMGFHAGWGAAYDQMIELLRSTHS